MAKVNNRAIPRKIRLSVSVTASLWDARNNDELRTAHRSAIGKNLRRIVRRTPSFMKHSKPNTAFDRSSQRTGLGRQFAGGMRRRIDVNVHLLTGVNR
jgi:hypothetical protein